jgi:stage IV sporulation protein FB
MSLCVGHTRIVVHPLALLYPLAAAMLGAGAEAAALTIALTFHEAAHLLAAHALGVSIVSLRLTPFGGAMAMENPYGLSPLRLAIVSAAGPVANALLLLTAGALAHWQMLSPGFALPLMQTNLLLLAFNLLPALPLDGGRIFYALLSLKFKRERALEIGILSGRAVAIMLLFACIAFAVRWHRVNLSFLFAAVFIWASAVDERRAFADAPMKAVLASLRPIDSPIPAQVCAVGADCAIRNALKAARPDTPTLYAVYKDDRLSSITDDRRLVRVALKRGMWTRVGEADKA